MTKSIIDLPKDSEWILNKSMANKKASYQFEIWNNNTFPDNIVQFETKTAKAMFNKIQRLVKKLK